MQNVGILQRRGGQNADAEACHNGILCFVRDLGFKCQSGSCGFLGC